MMMASCPLCATENRAALYIVQQYTQEKEKCVLSVGDKNGHFLCCGFFCPHRRYLLSCV
jgi:hypothetical protein